MLLLAWDLCAVKVCFLSYIDGLFVLRCLNGGSVCILCSVSLLASIFICSLQQLPVSLNTLPPLCSVFLSADSSLLSVHIFYCTVASLCHRGPEEFLCCIVLKRQWRYRSKLLWDFVLALWKPKIISFEKTPSCFFFTFLSLCILIEPKNRGNINFTKPDVWTNQRAWNILSQSECDY